jgi:hypothetical protein
MPSFHLICRPRDQPLPLTARSSVALARPSRRLSGSIWRARWCHRSIGPSTPLCARKLLSHLRSRVPKYPLWTFLLSRRGTASTQCRCEEVTNYLDALTYVRDRIGSRRPATLPAVLERSPQRLLRGARGGSEQPGEIRRSQNWIGGTRPGARGLCSSALR